MPPLDALPLLIDLDSPPILVERLFPAATRGGCAGSTLRPVSGALDSIGGVEATHAGVVTRLALKSHENGFLRVSDYTRLARALVHLAYPRRDRLEREAEGRRLRDARLAAGLSAGAAAKWLAVSRREFGRWESGEKRAPTWACSRILDRG